MICLSLMNPFRELFSSFNAQFQDLVSAWLILMATISLTCFIVSELTRNYSQVDKLWSLIPIAYGWITVAAFPTARIILMALLVTIWGLRLTYNFSRKGGYNIVPWKGEEDYRWKVMREKKALRGRFRFGLFNFFFISIYQNLIIFLISSPLLIASIYPDKRLTFVDIAASVFMLGFIIIEAIADTQLFRFHQEKRNGLLNSSRFKESLRHGFFKEGLWRYSRHPNFTCEQGIWIAFYFFSVAASGKWINITAAGPVLLVLLFMGSSRLTENISSSKYPGYKDYQKSVSRFLPRIFL